MDKKETLIKYWLKTSEADIDAAAQLLKAKKFPHALFFAHLSLEKMLKALFIYIREEYPPKTHNVLLLARTLNIEISKEEEKQLIEINSFNMEARYPDEKFKFYKKCTHDFSHEYFKIIKEMRLWLKKKLQKS